jgi:hypothetical protein
LFYLCSHLQESQGKPEPVEKSPDDTGIFRGTAGLRNRTADDAKSLSQQASRVATPALALLS